MSRAHRSGRALAWLAATALVIAACTGTQTDDAAPEPEPAEEAEEPEPDNGAEGTDAEAEEPTELEARLQEIADQVSVLRELPVEEEIDIEVVDPDELAGIVSEQGSDADYLERTAAMERVLVALRHLPEDADLQAILEGLLTTTVVGLYEPEGEVAYVSGEVEPLTPGAASTAAHELLHALQDQHFGLDRLDELSQEDGDAAMAFRSVVEGDAVVVEEEWAGRHQTEEERQEAEADQMAGAEEQIEQLQGAPPYVIESFVFPYVAGESFVTALVGEGGYEAVNEALEDPPSTTLEVLDPDQYLAGFEAGEIDIGGDPGDGWEPLFTSTFGAFDLLALFGAAPASDASQGSTAWPAWRAGSLEAWEREDEVVVAVAWAFEDSERADTVCGAVPSWYEEVADATAEGDVWRSDRDVLAVSCDGSEVRFAIGPEPSSARAALDGA